ncbi:molybdopterin synthase sulfur carrier subunit [Vibrio sp. RC27]
MIKVVFFAQTRELVGVGELSLDANFSNVESLRQHLAEQSDKWQLALESDQLLVAINQEIANFDSQVNDGDEVAFFPPVTGG